MNIIVIIFQLSLLLKVQSSVAQFPLPQIIPLIPKMNSIPDPIREIFKKFVDSIPVPNGAPENELLGEKSAKIFSSKMADAASQLLTVVASPLGPIATPYSLDFDLKSNSNVSYDYVIVGAGAAGSVLAARLSEDPNVNVLVIEAGGKENNYNVVPTFDFLQQRTPIDWGYYSVPQSHSAKGLSNQKIPTSRGKVVGGSTSINFMISVKGNRRDYDIWEELGATGWNSSAMNPYFIKMEGSLDPEAEPGYHGTKGPMPVSPLQSPFKVDTAFLNGIREYGLKIGDYNGADQERFNYASHNTKGGERWSSGRAYLSKASFRPNCHVLLYSRVNKIKFDDDRRAVGVDFTNNNKDYQVFARKKVIISAGAFETPKLLMLSGIGPKNQLDKFDIPIVHESPGVGNNLQDHAFTVVYLKTNYNTSFVLDHPETSGYFVQYATSRTGPFTSSLVNVNGFWRSKYAEDERPDIQINEVPLGTDALTIGILYYLFNLKRDTLIKYLVPYTQIDGSIMLVIAPRPRSTGTVKLASSNPRDLPLIDFNFFADPRDLDTVVEGCRLILNISQTSPMKAIGTQHLNSTLPGCEKYTFDSDDYLRCLAQTLTFTLWHAVGTAKMGSRDDPMAVVDPDLHVIGVKNLMVVDTSVLPQVPTGNTATPTMTVAERASDMLKGRLLRATELPFTDEDTILSDYVSYQMENDIDSIL